MMAYLVDDEGNNISRAEFSALPRVGDQIGVRLFAGFATIDGKEPSIPSAIMLKVEQVTFEAFNSDHIDNLQAWTYGHDAYALLRVSPVDEYAQTYMQYVKEQMKEDE